MTGRKFHQDKTVPAPASLTVASPGAASSLHNNLLCIPFQVCPEAQMKQYHIAGKNGLLEFLNPFYFDYLGIWEKGGRDLGSSASSILILMQLNKRQVFVLSSSERKRPSVSGFPPSSSPYCVICQFSCQHQQIIRQTMCEPSL